MGLVDAGEYAHVRLSVTDIVRSKAFYDQVFGWPIAIDRSDDVAKPGVIDSPNDFFGGTVYALPSGALLGLRPVARGGSFDSDRVGLDHLSFVVHAREDLVRAAHALDTAGIDHGQVTDHDGGAFLAFWDPDGISLELTAGS